MGSKVSKGKKVQNAKAKDQHSKQEVKKEEKPTEPIVVVPKEEKKEVKPLEEKDEHENKNGQKFQMQTGGHVGAFTKLDGGKIMKKVGKNEFIFYGTQLQKYASVQPFAPTFYGTETKEDLHYIVIEDLTAGFKKPCILDIKMGTSSVGEDASPEKKAAMEKKDFNTTTHSLGVRITAMKVYQMDKSDYVSYGKDWGKKVTTGNFLDSLKIYFHNGQEFRKELVASFLERLLKIQEWIESQGELRFYSSSILFIYDGDASNPKIEMKLIDFAHVHEITDGGKDQGYILGMKNLVEFMNQLQA